MISTISCDSVESLAACLDEAPPGSLFRGQTREYLRADGGPDLRTSFARLGCVPQWMLKWWHYSRTILASHVKAFDGATDLATDQAILQHYGWRSYFLDATSDPGVGAWFAGHAYQTRRSSELIEDCFEEPVFVMRSQAQYDPADEIGCLYILSRKALRARNIQAVDLVEIATAAGRPRYLAQSAFMVGPLKEGLSDDCVLTRVYAPSAVFRDYAARSPDRNQARLFPGVDEDPVLATLLSVPWVKRQDVRGIGIDYFERGLQIPEYDARSIRRTMASEAYYRRFWLADSDIEASQLAGVTFYLTSESLYHGVGPKQARYPLLTALLQETVGIAVEIDGLVRHPYHIGSHSYGKGIYLEQQEDGLVLVTELQVKHPGGHPAGFGITRGRYYRPEADGRWTEARHKEECDCGGVEIHHHHLVVAAHFEVLLADNVFHPVRERVFATDDVVATTDPAVTPYTQDSMVTE